MYRDNRLNSQMELRHNLFTLTDGTDSKCLTAINDSTIETATCKTSTETQQWDFRHRVVTYPFPLEFIPTIKELKQKEIK